MNIYPDTTARNLPGSMPSFHPDVQQTPAGTRYLTSPGVVMIAQPQVDLGGVAGYLGGLSQGIEERLIDYLADPVVGMSKAAQLCKFSGQLCYLAFGSKRTKNAQAEVYFDNILKQKHGNILEHANYSFLIYGVSRSLTHELVRHRAGCSFSQISQRYVDGTFLRFVERPEYQSDSLLHQAFIERIDRAAADYELTAQRLHEVSTGEKTVGRGTDARKAVNQAARSLLPNETETALVMTANVRAWRHVLEMRGSLHAEKEIRLLSLWLFRALRSTDPILFGDITEETSFAGEAHLKVKHSKV